MGKKKDKKIQEYHDYLLEHSLWKRYEGCPLNEEQAEFVTNCMTQNLEHVRHVENERLNFNTIFLALVAGTFAFADSFNSNMTLVLYVVMTLAGFLSMILTTRWNNAFERHLFFAQRCYAMLHINLFKGAKTEGTEGKDTGERDILEFIPDINETPMYCFRIRQPFPRWRKGDILYKSRTNHLYTAFYWMIQLILIMCTISEFLNIF